MTIHRLKRGPLRSGVRSSTTNRLFLEAVGRSMSVSRRTAVAQQGRKRSIKQSRLGLGPFLGACMGSQMRAVMQITPQKIYSLCPRPFLRFDTRALIIFFNSAPLFECTADREHAIARPTRTAMLYRLPGFFECLPNGLPFAVAMCGHRNFHQNQIRHCNCTKNRRPRDV